MTTEDYQRALKAAAREYEALGEQRQQIDKRLGELAQTIATLSRLCGLTATVPWGLTDACRTVLRSAGRPMSPLEVRDRLAGIGFDLTRYTNDLAAIHTTLKRLNESEELRFTTRGSGEKAYIWERPAHVDGLGPAVAAIMHGPATRSPRTGRKREK